MVTKDTPSQREGHLGRLTCVNPTELNEQRQSRDFLKTFIIIETMVSPVEERARGIGKRRSYEISVAAVFFIAVERQVSKFQAKMLGR